MAKVTQREKTVQCRVSDEEYEVIEKKAEALGLTVSNYLRMVCLHARIDISFNGTQNNDK